MKTSKSSKSSAFTLVELLISFGVVGLVLSVCVGSYVTLSRGFEYITRYSDLNNSMCRVLDCTGVDLRNATAISTTNTSPIQTITATIPRRYANYFPGSSVRAGEPDEAVATGTIGTVTVRYSGTTQGTQASIIRTLTSGTTTAARTVATFPYGAVMTGTGTAATSGTLWTVSLTGTVQHGKIITSSTMQTTIYPRGK